MARLTERVRVTVSAEIKAEWKTKAAARNMSLSAYLREIAETLLAEHELEVACAELEMQITEPTIQ